jgi:hypothetical protein
MTTDNFCFYLQNRLIQTSQTGGQWYSDTSPFSFPWHRSSTWCQRYETRFFFAADDAQIRKSVCTWQGLSQLLLNHGKMLE